jgi:Family of unknown function (DUF5999)
MCPHQPSCPPAYRPDRDAARTVAFHPEQGWSLLCNGVIVFDDMGEILPDGRIVPPHHSTRVRPSSQREKRGKVAARPYITRYAISDWRGPSTQAATESATWRLTASTAA